MLSLTNRIILLVMLSLYPFAVFFLWEKVSPFVLVLSIVGILFIKSLISSKHLKELRKLSMSLEIFICVVLVFSYFTVGKDAVFFYPVLMSLSMGFLFLASLIWPPNLIARFATITDPSLDATAMRYTRAVTIIWGIFCLFNAAVSYGTSILGDMYIWTLYNGCISYILMGILFLGEYLFRYYFKRKDAQ